MTGSILIVLGFVRMGWVSNFMARPVLEGFIIGLAITIAVGQADKLFGIEKDGSNTLQELGSLVRQFSDWRIATMAVGFGSLALLFLMHRYTPRIPAALTVVILAIMLSAVLGFDESGINIVGDIPAGLPGLGLPTWPEGLPIDDLILGALAVTIVAYAESLAAAQSYARKHGYLIDSNQELIGLGVANVGAGLSQGFVVNGSLSKTAAGESAGQRTQMAGLVAAIVTIVTILFLTGLFFNLPEATLGAIVVHAVWKLINVDKLKPMWRVRKEDFWAGVVALAGVLFVDVLAGIVIGVVLSLIILIYRASFPSATEPGHIDVGDRDTFVSIDEFPGAMRIQEIVVHRFNANLIFSNADAFADSVLDLLYDSSPPARIAVIDCEMMSDMDMTGAARLDELVHQLRGSGVDVHISRLHGDANTVAERSGVLDSFGQDHVHFTVADAVAVAQEALLQQPSPTDATTQSKGDES